MDQEHEKDQSASNASTPPVRRPHLPPRYLPEETDLMYMDETIADVAVEIPRNSQAEQEPPALVEDPTPPVLDRPRRGSSCSNMDERLCILISEMNFSH